MAEEKGIVIETGEDFAIIKARRDKACEGCSQKSSCRPGEGDDMLIEADNPVNARVGDEVVFAVSTSASLKAGALLYLFPLASFIVGVLVGDRLGSTFGFGAERDAASAVFGLVFLAAAFLVVRITTRSASRARSYRPTIIRVVHHCP
ncbi:MAG TPA: hypothetical protein ENJ37_01950 [Deltaproteobacteria bacterium]|nr:hypothetical protein [Deltaproteobacteria bacterium]